MSAHVLLNLLNELGKRDFDLLIFELMFLFFKNTVKKTKIQVYILPIS